MADTEARTKRKPLPETYCSSGAECPNCGTVAEDDDGWISKHGEDNVEFTCDGCGAPLITYASFSVSYSTKIAPPKR